MNSKIYDLLLFHTKWLGKEGRAREKKFHIKEFFIAGCFSSSWYLFFSSSSSLFIVKWGFTVFKATNDGTHAYSIGLCCAVLTPNRAMYEKKEACKKEDFILDDVEFCCVTDLASVENRWWLTHLVRLLSQHTILLTKQKKNTNFYFLFYIFFSITFDFLLFLHLYLYLMSYSFDSKRSNQTFFFVGPWIDFLLFFFLARQIFYLILIIFHFTMKGSFTYGVYHLSIEGGKSVARNYVG